MLTTIKYVKPETALSPVLAMESAFVERPPTVRIPKFPTPEPLPSVPKKICSLPVVESNNEMPELLLPGLRRKLIQ